MKKNVIMAATAAVAVALCAAQAPGTAAQRGTAPTTAAGKAKGAVNDRLFAAAAAASSHAEIALAQIAEARASGDAVKKFARQMIEDHTQANQQLTRLAATKQMALPQGPDVTDQAAADALNGLSGEEFDREYVKNQVAAHICAVQLFTAEAERGQDPDLKALAGKLLPKLKDHLHMAKGMMPEDRDEKSPHASR